MSVAVMSDVWAGYPGGGSELLTLLALADYGNDDGLSIHPSIEALARKVRISESRVRRILRELEAQNLLMVVGNHAGGTPGTTRQYRLNVRKIRAMGDKARDEMQAAKRTKKKTCDIPDFTDFDNMTPCASATPCVDATPCASATPPLAPAHMTPCASASLTTIEPSIEPPYNRHIPPVAVAPVAGSVFLPIDDIVVNQAKPAPVGTVAVVEAAEVVEHTPTAKPNRKRTVVDTGTDETALQAACRTTWAAYSGAYAIRYGVAPLRNAKVNAAIKGFVQRIGYDESPAVAAYYVANVNDAFVVRNMHDTGLLLKQAEGYRTQWATGRSVTATAARQADQTAANLSVVEEAKLIARQRRAAREAARLAGEDFL